MSWTFRKARRPKTQILFAWAVVALLPRRVAVGPEKSGSALTADVLLAGFGVKIEPVFDSPEEAVKKLGKGDIDALIFIAGAPMPAFQNLDKSFHFVTLPVDSGYLAR